MNEQHDYNSHNWTDDKNKAHPYSIYSLYYLSMSFQVTNIENTKDPTLAWFDTFAGCDLIGNLSGSIFGIATRVQFTDAPFNTFTVRYERHTGTKTEYEKRTEAIKNGYFYPKYTLQAYVSESGSILSAAMVKTNDLYDFIEKYPYLVNESSSDNVFKYINWSDLKRTKYWINIYIK